MNLFSITVIKIVRIWADMLINLGVTPLPASIPFFSKAEMSKWQSFCSERRKGASSSYNGCSVSEVDKMFTTSWGQQPHDTTTKAAMIL